MHIPTTALIAISFYIIGISSTVHPDENEKLAPSDGFDLADFEIKCNTQVYNQSIIYKTAEHACKTNARDPKLRKRGFNTAGYRNNYQSTTVRVRGDHNNWLYLDIDIVPIKSGGVFSFEMDAKTRLRTIPFEDLVQSDPAFDRLAVGKNCFILGIFTDMDHPSKKNPATVNWCKVHGKSSDVGISTSRSPENSSERASRYPYFTKKNFSVRNQRHGFYFKP